MARKGTKRLYLYPADALAKQVVDKYVSEVPRKLGDMSRNYASGITTYLRDPAKRANAVQKLSMWYDALYGHVDSIVDTYSAIRKDYKAKLKAVKGVVMPPPVVARPAPAV